MKNKSEQKKLASPDRAGQKHLARCSNLTTRGDLPQVRSLEDIELEILEHMSSNGMPFRGTIPFNTGRFHRWSIDNDKNKKDESLLARHWEYQGKLYASCFYMSFSCESKRFTYKSWEGEKSSLSPEELKVIEFQERQRLDILNRDLEEKRKEAAALACDIFNNASNEPSRDEHKAYLRKKRILQPAGVRFGEFEHFDREAKKYSKFPALIIPAYNIEGKIVSLQYIYYREKGKFVKHFLYRGQKKGTFFPIGDIKNAPRVMIVEGFATGCTIHEATGDAVAVAWDAGGLSSVTEMLKEKYPYKTFIIAGDNDASGVGNKAAKKAAEENGCNFVIPIDSGETKIGFRISDFNDLMLFKGHPEVKSQLDSVLGASPEWNKPLVSNAPSVAEMISSIGDPEDNVERVVNELNKNFSIIQSPSPFVLYKDDEELRQYTKFDLIDLFYNQRVVVGYKEARSSKKAPIPVLKSKAKIWLDSPKRKTYKRIDFRPDKGEVFIEKGQPILNSWKGLAVKPIKGDCSLFKAHILNIICDDDKESYAFLWNLLSCWVQKPERRSCSPVLRGAPGSGKGTFTETIGKIFGDGYLSTCDHENVFGRFNGALMGKVLVHLDEALFGGDRKVIGKVKGLITSEKFCIEIKNKDAFDMNNPRKVMLSSNESFAIPVDANDRRFLFLDVSDHRCGDVDYFKELYKEIDNGGLQALVFELLATNLTGFNPYQLPTAELKHGFDNKIASSNSFLKYLYSCLSEGGMNPDLGERS